ncbi:unnamed protein product [Bathycoccus prasinos]
MKEDSLTVTTTSSNTIRLHTTSINNTSRLEARRFSPEDSQLVDISPRQVTDDALGAQEPKEATPEENYDSEKETEAYQPLGNAEEYLD